MLTSIIQLFNTIVKEQKKWLKVKVTLKGQMSESVFLVRFISPRFVEGIS